MNYVILYRVNEGKVEAVLIEDSNDVAEFSSIDRACSYVDRNVLFTSGQASYQIVELDEL